MDISVIIPVDGRYTYLARSLKTILRQPAPASALSAEIIVVDNAADAELRRQTRTACIRVAQEHQDARVLLRYVATRHVDPRHHNVSYPRNVGIHLASAPVVLMTDADILHVTETLLQHVERHRRHDNLLVYSYCRDCEPSLELATSVLASALHDQHHALRMAACTDWFGGMCHSAKRRHLLEVGGFEEGFKAWGYEDYDLARRMRHQGAKILRDDDIQVLHMIHPPSSRGAWSMKVRAGIRQLLGIQTANRGRRWGQLSGEPETIACHPSVHERESHGVSACG